MSALSVAALREAALAAERSGAAAEANELFDRATALVPADPGMRNSAAGSALRLGDFDRAERLYREAQQLAPHDPEIVINLAIVLTRRSDFGAAVDLLRAHETLGANLPRYWSSRASAERSAGDLAAAEASYGRSLSLDPANPRALHGSAWVALERGKSAVVQFDRAIVGNRADREVWFGRALALEASGDRPAAIAALSELVARAPDYGQALLQLAQWRSVEGDPDAWSHFVTATSKRPGDPGVPLKWCEALASANRYAEAADLARRARRRFPRDARYPLLEAIYAGEAGDDEAAQLALKGMDPTPVVQLELARQLLRQQDPAAASAILEKLTGSSSTDVLAWALQGLAWRLQDDPRSNWLHGQPGLVERLNLELDPAKFDAIRDLLSDLHARASQPLGQSVRDGTQTRGSLLAREEPEVAHLGAALRTALERYRSGLPPRDERHPLLRVRDDRWGIAGSWSVRLGHGGHHISHIHPNGVISSAAYLVLPPADATDPLAGALELGRPPSGLRLDLEPLVVIPPLTGTLVLFPSTLYHGTRPFGSGVRMTAAIDVAPISVD